MLATAALVEAPAVVIEDVIETPEEEDEDDDDDTVEDIETAGTDNDDAFLTDCVSMSDVFGRDVIICSVYLDPNTLAVITRMSKVVMGVKRKKRRKKNMGRKSEGKRSSPKKIKKNRTRKETSL